MKIPIEFIHRESSTSLPESETFVAQNLPLFTPFGAYEKLMADSVQQRLVAAEEFSKVYEKDISFQAAELKGLEYKNSFLDNSELMKMLAEIQSIVDRMAAVRITLFEAIAGYVAALNSAESKNMRLDLIDRKLARFKSQILDEIEALRALTEPYHRDFAYIKTVNMPIREAHLGELRTNIDLMQDKLIDIDNRQQIQSNKNVNDLKQRLANLEDIIDHFECWSKSLAMAATKLLEIARALYKDTRKQWLRLITGSYIRLGDHMQFNRDCVAVEVTAVQPPLTKCEKPKFLQRPPAEYEMVPPQPIECPECVKPVAATVSSLILNTFKAGTVNCSLSDVSLNRALDDDYDLLIDGEKVLEIYAITETYNTINLHLSQLGSTIEFRLAKKNKGGKRLLALNQQNGPTIFANKELSSEGYDVGDIVWTFHVRPYHLSFNITETKSSEGGDLSYYVRGGLKAMGLRNLVDNVMPFFFVYTKEYLDSPTGLAAKAQDLQNMLDWMQGKEGFAIVQTEDTRQISSICKDKVGTTYYYRE